MCMFACLCMLACSCEHGYPKNPEEDAKSGVGGSGCPEPPHVGAGNRTWVSSRAASPPHCGSTAPVPSYSLVAMAT